MGPSRGDSQHGDGAARFITFWFRSLESHNSLEGGFIVDTLALATGTRVGASDHTIARFCIEYGRVLGFVR